mmetsp:Transcript_49936/g.60335  ORF Transcript_49936/g.60335 Transcript_49936/m.60335 type:complete len:82 (+) Transcript_49936:170-415(+)
MIIVIRETLQESSSWKKQNQQFANTGRRYHAHTVVITEVTIWQWRYRHPHNYESARAAPVDDDCKHDQNTETNKNQFHTSP